MTAPTIGTWYAVKSGPQRGAEGVVDFVRDFPAGTFYRLTNPITKVVVGRFRAEQLVEVNAPVYESQVSDDVRRQAMDLLTKGTRS